MCVCMCVNGRGFRLGLSIQKGKKPACSVDLASLTTPNDESISIEAGGRTGASC